MNFLAHLYLSGKDDDLIFGNFIADAVKGNAMNGYPPGIAKGIRLHREIDHYTDRHPVFRQSRSRLSPKYHMFSGVIVDLYYDHFLCKLWNEYSHDDLHDTVSHAYFLLIRRYHLLPPRSKKILPFMVTRNWLVNYANLNSLQRVFLGMSHRTKHDSGMENAISDLKAYYSSYEQEFRDFFPDIVSHITEFREKNLNWPEIAQELPGNTF